MYLETKLVDLAENNLIYELLREKLQVNPIDFQQTLAHVCAENGFNPLFVESLIQLYDQGGIARFSLQKMESFSIEELTFYIQKSHAFYLEKKLPELQQSANHLIQMCVDPDSLHAQLGILFSAYTQKLKTHFEYEEKQLIPYIHRLLLAETAGENGTEILNTYSSRQFLNNHTHIEDELHIISAFIREKTIASFHPLPFRIFLNQLHAFEMELNFHALIEDEVLLPKVAVLEHEMRLKF